MDRKKETILKATAALTENYKNEELFMPKNDRSLPSRAAIIDIVKELRSIIFPGYFWNDSAAKMFPEYFAGYRLNDLYDRLKEQSSQIVSVQVFLNSFRMYSRSF